MDGSSLSRYKNYMVPFKQQLEVFRIFTHQKAKIRTKKKIINNNGKKL